jgi:hypothetical protein
MEIAPIGRRLLLVLAAMLARPGFAFAQNPADTIRVSLIYTGRTFGALGVRRAQSEHELLTEQANREKSAFKLASHMAWRAPGLVILLPGQEPAGDELSWILAHRSEAERLSHVAALSSANALLFQDPWRPSPDLLGMIERNPRRASDFPDLVKTTISVSRLRTPSDQRVFIVEQEGAVWPSESSDWSIGEMNRVDVLDSRLLELPLNLGQLGSRATLVARMEAEARARSSALLLADLGHEEGDFGLASPDRARLDLIALGRLKYSLLVPYDFELGLGADTLRSLFRGFPSIQALAANVSARDSSLFAKRLIMNAGGVRVGFTGVVNSMIRNRLPRARLADFEFEDAVAAVKKQVALLRAEGSDAVVVLSNMDAADNASIAREVSGIDAIVADLPVAWAPEVMRTRVELPERPYARPGAPALIARAAANGIAVGRLDIEFHRAPNGKGMFVSAIENRVEPVTDRIPPDTSLVRAIASLANPVKRPQGDLMFPAFVDLADRHPELRNYDSTTQQGRVSKEMWEAFMARTLRIRARAEVAVVRRLEQFPPLIGKLHENEIGGWLWTEDEIVVLDVAGSDLKRLLSGASAADLAASGIDTGKWTVAGHKLDDQVYYRVATVDVLYEGSRSIGSGRRVRRRFVVGGQGQLLPSSKGKSLTLRDFIHGELKLIRRGVKSDVQIDRLAALLAPDPKYINLLAFTFDRPTFWASLNQVQGGKGYGSVSESRVTAKDSWVRGVSGRFVASQVRLQNTVDFGTTISYARQEITSNGKRHVGESADDLKFDLTLRPTARAGSGPRMRPFVRGLFDTEFTPTIDPATGAPNAKQLALRGSSGFMASPGTYWRRAELAVAVENDFGRPNMQFGFQTISDLLIPIGVLRRTGIARPSYRLYNDATYLLPARRDSPRDLALRYNMIHEIIVPLVDELSLSAAADLFFFQGKVAATRTPGVSMLLRVGLTYDRLWKPHYQPFL